MRTFAVTREPAYPGWGDLNGTRGNPPDDFLILIDGQQVGATYWCVSNPATAGFGHDDGGLPGQSWASWGPRGLSCGHPTREAAEQAQVREYVTDPDRFDRLLAMDRANSGARS